MAGPSMNVITESNNAFYMHLVILTIDHNLCIFT